jgi:hypothetical protein
MLVLNSKCKKCYNICNAIYFQQQFIDWTSGNNGIDKVIHDSQISAHKDVPNVLEWIPYNRFYNIKCIMKAKMYKANWIDGYIKYWDDKNQNWEREDYNMLVMLKSLNNSDNSVLEFRSKV